MRAISELEGREIAVDFYFNPDPEADRGYYIHPDILAVNIADRSWKYVFLHEYCHFLQHQSNCPHMQRFQENPENIEYIAAMEQECEARVIGLLSYLELNYDKYARSANEEHLVSYFGEKYAI